jgi:hypothetical protein
MLKFKKFTVCRFAPSLSSVSLRLGNSRVKYPAVILRKLHGWLMNFCGILHHCVVTEAATIWVLCPCEQD